MLIWRGLRMALDVTNYFLNSGTAAICVYPSVSVPVRLHPYLSNSVGVRVRLFESIGV